MAKSTTIKKNPAESGSTVTRKKTSKAAAGKSEATKTRAPRASKATKPAAKKAAAPKALAIAETPFSLSAKPSPCVSTSDIALRAYYLGEKRQKLGLPGDSAHDWIEAERQLVSEAQASPNTNGA